MSNQQISRPLFAFQKELASREVPINTLELQQESLYSFAKKLGYSVCGTYPSHQGFVNHKAPRECLKFISFDTMKHYHNNPFNPYSFSKEMSVAAAASSRLVSKVKLQRTKRGIEVQNHYVKLVVNDKDSYLKSQLAAACPSLTPNQLDQLVSKRDELSGLVV